MNIFGNLLQAALSVIPAQTVTWEPFVGRTTGPSGKFIDTFGPGVPVSGSWQAVDSQTIHQLGLDSRQVHKRLYTSNPIAGVNRGTAPDRIVAEGFYWEVRGDADWYELDGWKGIIATRLGPAT